MRVAKFCLTSVGAVLLALALVGCQGRASIPADAQLETSAAGKNSYTAKAPGNVFVLDADKNEKVFEGHVNDGDQIVVEPTENRIVVGGNNAEHKTLHPDHRYEIYFRGAQ